MRIKAKYLQLTQLYRAQVHDCENVDFSEAALEACYLYESEGIVDFGWMDKGKQLVNQAGEINGFLLGKWMLDINMAAIVEDIKNGVMAKVEFRDCEYAWYYWPRIEHIQIPVSHGVFGKNPI